jgi:DNA-binding PadR family transcriptional regulator
MEKVADAWGQEMRRGYTKFAVLTVLSKASASGYGIMKAFQERTLGFWKVTSGGMYPILQELEDRGYIQGEWKSRGRRKRKVYEITDEGKQILSRALKKQQQIAEVLRGLIRDYAQDILEIEVPPNLPSPPMDMFSVIEQMDKRPMEEQRRVLRQIRDQMQSLIKRIDERLAQVDVEAAS